MACLLGKLTTAAVEELRLGDNVSEIVFKDFEFSIISFYNASNSSQVEIDSYMDGANALFNQMIEDGVISQRRVGWFRIELEDNPTMGPAGVTNDQIVMGKLGQRKYLDFKKEFNTKEENEAQLANLMKELTGDFMTHIECEYI